MSDINLKASIEAVLFAIGGAVDESKLLSALGSEEEPLSKKEFKAAVKELMEDYEYEDILIIS